MDQETNTDRLPAPISGSVKIGATVGMTAGWLIALVYVFSRYPFSFGFNPGLQGTIDGVMMAGPIRQCGLS
jgi:hypothetical protein